jgi:hypothetical protein
VRVKLRRVSCDRSIPYPHDGQGKEWWDRLKQALGTCSSDFVNVTLIQIQTAARLPFHGTSEVAVNAALAIIEGARPRNEIEAISAIQLACTHAATMTVLTRLGNALNRQVAPLASAAARLIKASASQAELLRKLQGGGAQYVRVEHVHVSEGGQAVIGNVSATRSDLLDEKQRRKAAEA